MIFIIDLFRSKGDIFIETGEWDSMAVDCTEFEKLRPLQQIHCEMIDYLDHFCTENGISWCLARGSALGAARHGGPIPWDDDADIYMTAEDYAKFRTLFRQKGDRERFYLQELDCVDGMLPMPKFRLNGTTFIEPALSDRDMHHGIYVDIYLLHGFPESRWKQLLAETASMYALLKRLSNHNYIKRKIVRPVMVFLRWFPADFGLRTAYGLMYQSKSDEASRLADWEKFKGKPRWYFERDVIFPIRRMDYNGYSFCVPNQLDRYLTAYYGSWRTPPSQEEIRWGQHAVTWSVQEDFRKFVPNIQDFRDEKLR